MAKLIKQIADLIDLATDKGITTYHTPAQKMDVVDSVQMALWRELIQKYPRDKRVRNDLLPFEAQASITCTSSVGSLPTGCEQEIEAYVTTNSIKYPVQIVENGFFRRRVLDPIDPPSTTNVFMRIYNDTTRKIEVSPQITPVILSYWIRPTKPVYATTTASQPLYDDTASTDVLWSATVHDIIVERSLKMLGVGLREGILVQVGQPPQPKEATL